MSHEVSSEEWHRQGKQQVQRPCGRSTVSVSKPSEVASEGEVHVDEVEDHNKDLVSHSEQEGKSMEGYEQKTDITDQS